MAGPVVLKFYCTRGEFRLLTLRAPVIRLSYRPRHWWVSVSLNSVVMKGLLNKGLRCVTPANAVAIVVKLFPVNTVFTTQIHFKRP
jgi:hypothetical protein